MTRRIRILLSGLPGQMSSEVARRLFESPEEFEVIDQALVGPEITAPEVRVDARVFRAVPPSAREDFVKRLESGEKK